MGFTKCLFLELLHLKIVNKCNEDVNSVGPPEWGRVIYDENKQNDIISEYIDNLYTLWEKTGSKIFTGSASTFLPEYLLMLKTKEYCKEDELRVIIQIENNEFIRDNSWDYVYMDLGNYLPYKLNKVILNNNDILSSTTLQIEKAFKKFEYGKTKIEYRK